MPGIPAIRRQRQENLNFQTSLVYIMRSNVKNNNKAPPPKKKAIKNKSQ
jgi:hypothetical protein